MKNISSIILLLLFIAGAAFFVWKKTVVHNNSTIPAASVEKDLAKLATELIEVSDIKKIIGEQYELSRNYLVKVPTKVDETYFVKKTAATWALTFYESKKGKILEDCYNRIKVDLENLFSEAEFKTLIAQQKTASKDNSSDIAASNKFKSYLASKKFKDISVIPRKQMSESYQYYLTEVRKRYHINDGSFVVPK